MSLRMSQRIDVFLRLALVPQLMVGYSLAVLTLMMIQSQSHSPHRWILRLSQVFSRICLRILRIRVSTSDFERITKPHARPKLLVANHLSYLDVLAMYSIHPAVFVTSVEVRDTPVLGQLCRLGGCLFVERRKIWNLPQEVRNLTTALDRGYDVVLFPESTTTDGSAMMPFKSSLVQAAVQAGAEVQPVVINYRDARGQRLTLSNRDDYYWYGDMTFTPHLLRVLSGGGVRLRLTALEPLCAQKLPQRKQLTRRAEAAIAAAFEPVRV